MAYTEKQACTALPINENCFNRSCILPYGLKVEHIKAAMVDFIGFLSFINSQLYTQQIPRLETMLMSANFSSIVGEFMSATIPKHCGSLVKNRYHNGHPDLIPASMFVNNAIQYASEGIEIKASRYNSAWQGHNPENVWLMVFVFNSDSANTITPKPFAFVKVVGAYLSKEDWKFSGRSAQSRRTITASVTKSGYDKMTANWIYNTSFAQEVQQ
jgi:hypothetical protein